MRAKRIGRRRERLESWEAKRGRGKNEKDKGIKANK